jgi:hypothetical protein
VCDGPSPVRGIGCSHCSSYIQTSFFVQRQLVIPYLVFCSVAAVVSVFALGQKTLLFVSSTRSRHADVQHGPVKLDGVEFSAELAELEAVKRLKEKFDENHLERSRLYWAILLGVCEGTCVPCLYAV